MAAKAKTSSNAKTWLERHLSDGQEYRIDDLLIRGMMAGYSEQTLRHAAHALHVTRRYAQEETAEHSAFVECWQLPTSLP